MSHQQQQQRGGPSAPLPGCFCFPHSPYLHADVAHGGRVCCSSLVSCFPEGLIICGGGAAPVFSASQFYCGVFLEVLLAAGGAARGGQAGAALVGAGVNALRSMCRSYSLGESWAPTLGVHKATAADLPRDLPVGRHQGTAATFSETCFLQDRGRTSPHHQHHHHQALVVCLPIQMQCGGTFFAGVPGCVVRTCRLGRCRSQGPYACRRARGQHVYNACGMCAMRVVDWAGRPSDLLQARELCVWDVGGEYGPPAARRRAGASKLIAGCTAAIDAHT